MLSESRILNVL